MVGVLVLGALGLLRPSAGDNAGDIFLARSWTIWLEFALGGAVGGLALHLLRRAPSGAALADYSRWVAVCTASFLTVGVTSTLLRDSQGVLFELGVLGPLAGAGVAFTVRLVRNLGET